MRRVHFPPRSITPLQRLACTFSFSGIQAAHNLALSSKRHLSTESDSPRIIFSGIQPTGIPHVRPHCIGHIRPTLTMVSARKLLWRACKLGQVTRCRCPGRQAILLHRRLACPHTTTRSQSTRGGADHNDSFNSCVWHRSSKVRSLPSG
jgi:hypothetical protein